MLAVLGQTDKHTDCNTWHQYGTRIKGDNWSLKVIESGINPENSVLSIYSLYSYIIICIKMGNV